MNIQSNATAVMKRNPTRATRRVEKCIQNGPITDCVDPSFIASVSLNGDATEPYQDDRDRLRSAPEVRRALQDR
jgi:hypothetical protein